MKKIIFGLLAFLAFINVYKAEELAPNAKSAVLMNYETGQIVYEKNSKEKLPPASMTKMMTLLLIMEAIDEGSISYTDEVIISKNAASMGGSQIFVEEGSKLKVEELIKGIAIASGNDAAVAMSEKIGGSLENFVAMMNDKCSEIGCVNTHFANVHGLDDDNHYSCAHDMALIGKELVHHQDILRFTSTYEEYLNKPDGTKIWLVNTNKLVRFMPGVDGLKTGFTANAMYCLTATGLLNNIRFISTVMGVPTSTLRSEDTTNLLNYGFNNYKINEVISEDKDLGEVNIQKGKVDKVNLKVVEGVRELKKINEESSEYEYIVNVDKSIKAPVYKGNVIGSLDVLNNGTKIYSVDLTVKEDVLKSSVFDLFIDNLKVIFCGK